MLFFRSLANGSQSVALCPVLGQKSPVIIKNTNSRPHPRSHELELLLCWAQQHQFLTNPWVILILMPAKSLRATITSQKLEIARCSGHAHNFSNLGG